MKFKESDLAHKLLDGLVGIEIGASAHNPFGLNTKNVDYTADLNTPFKQEELRMCGECARVDIVSLGDNLPFPDASQDFVISSHVLEHFVDPINTLREWYRVIKTGGYIYLIIPHRERTFDREKPRTTLVELISRQGQKNRAGDWGHQSFWITEDVVELVGYLGWEIVAVQEVDDKVGNGFAIVIKKGNPPTLFINCTHTYGTGLNTGIQRVVRNLVSQLTTVGPQYGYLVKPVVMRKGVLTVVPVIEVLRKGNWWRPSWWRAQYESRREKKLDQYLSHEGNILLIPEICSTDDLFCAVSDFKIRGGNIQSLVYDLIPLTHPTTVYPEAQKSFLSFLTKVIKYSNQLISISNFTKQELEKFLKNKKISTKARLDFFHLSSELDLARWRRPNQILTKIFAGPDPVFLVVGSIEPRKNHRYVLEAFNIFWQRGGRASLVIIGQVGWKSDDLLEELNHHPRFNKNLFLLRTASDDDLDYAYQRAAGLIFASIVEGFGLPLVEAWHYGLKIFCSDIPVFREIANERATFFDLSLAENLTDLISDYCQEIKKTSLKKQKYQWLTLAESAHWLMRVLIIGKSLSPRLSTRERRVLIKENHYYREINRKIYSLNELLVGSDEIFVKNLYRKLLQREADRDGLKNYQDKLIKRELSRPQVIKAIFYSVEGLSNDIKVVGLSQKKNLIKLFKYLATLFFKIRNFFRRRLQYLLAKFQNKKEESSPYHQAVVEREKKVLLRGWRQSSARPQPLISIITPVHELNDKILQETIASVRAQTYPCWEWCLTCSCPQQKIRSLLREEALKDSRLKINFLPQNEGISENTNQALKLAQGEIIVFLDHDDTLAPDALVEVAAAFHRDVDIVYSDEDKIGLTGEFCQPFFKPDWSPHFLLAANYLAHLIAYRRDFLERVGIFRRQYDGAQDYDFVLRATEKAKKIIHLPKILYHWRMTLNSTALSARAKPYCRERTIAVIEETLKRRGLVATVAESTVRPFDINYQIAPDLVVSLIIPTKDKVELLRSCLNSILTKTSFSNFEIIVLDNNSQNQETHEYYKQLEAEADPRIKVAYYQKPFNYSAINNFATKIAKGDFFIFLNNDTEVISPDWLQALVGLAGQPLVGAVGAKLLFPDGTIQHAGVINSEEGVGHAFSRQNENTTYFNFANLTRNCGAVTGACLAISRKVFEQIGGFDESYLVPFSDIDLCFRLRQAGYLNVYTPLAVLYHYESITRGYRPSLADEKLFLQHWSSLIQKADPYYNLNFDKRLRNNFQWRGFFD